MANKNRCAWVSSDQIYIDYHDNEWGVPILDDERQFEFLVLETFQAGLSWLIVLKKRQNFRVAFDNFDYHKIANYNEEKIDELIGNEGIIRNKLKINATVSNAKSFILIQQEFGSFSKYLWAFFDNKPLVNHWDSHNKLPSKTELSDKISNDLKKRGFKFVGSTVIYAHLQATGLINDHLTTCFRYNEL